MFLRNKYCGISLLVDAPKRGLLSTEVRLSEICKQIQRKLVKSKGLYFFRVSQYSIDMKSLFIDRFLGWFNNGKMLVYMEFSYEGNETKTIWVKFFLSLTC